MLEHSLEEVAKTLMTRAYTFTCSYETAWEKWMYPYRENNYTLEEVKQYIKNNTSKNKKKKRFE